MSLKDRQRKVIDEFSSLSDWEDRYRRIIDLGKQLEPLPEQYKTDEFKVKGCQSQVWLRAQLNSQRQIVFQADSDALIVRGLIALLLQVYSSSTPDEILETPPQFISQLGFERNLSPSRANGLMAMVKQIKYYALGFRALLLKPEGPH